MWYILRICKHSNNVKMNSVKMNISLVYSFRILKTVSKSSPRMCLMIIPLALIPLLELGMDRIAVLPVFRHSGYPSILKSRLRISGQISGGCRIPDIRPDTRYFSWVKIQISFLTCIRYNYTKNWSILIPPIWE